MKKTLLLLMALLATVGLTMAQDVYYSGYYNYSGTKYATVYKNGEKLYEKTVSGLDSECTSVVVDPATNDVYWTRCNASYGDVIKNDNVYLSQNSGTYINNLHWSTQNNSLYSAGFKKGSDGKKYATIWHGNSTTPYLQPNNGNGKESEAFDLEFVKSNNNGNWTYYCGYANATESGSPRATVWKGSSVLYTLSSVNSRAIGLDYYNGSVYTVGYEEIDNVSSNKVIKVWKNNDVKYTLTSPGSVNVFKIKIDCGDVWVIGYGESRAPVCVWKNGEVIQTIATSYTARGLDVNTTGYYAAYNNNGNPKIYKDGSVLYETTPDCEYIYDLFVTEPESDPATRTLPYFEGFEMGETDWNSWTVIDDEEGSDMFDYWQRYGRQGSGFQPYTGDYCGMHWARSGYSEEGWLISPKLFLQPGRDQTTMTFKSYESSPSSYVYEGVWVSTTNTNPSSFTEVWSQTASNASASWKTISVNLKAYQGQAIYIAFKYSNNNGTSGHSWLIDDVNVTESWSPCTTPITSFPQSWSFDYNPFNSTCWYLLDNDHTGDLKCWQWDESSKCVKHPDGQNNGINQEGWLITAPIQLTAGQNYTLSFKTKYLYSSYANDHSSVWIALDKSGVPDPADYTQIWVENESNSASGTWATRTVDLTSYAGHKINIAFKYEGIYAHVWNLDDITITEALPEYNVSVQSNNTAWGTVDGGGTFTQNTAITITATPNSGYEFKKWTKDGSDVSTSASYSFNVTEATAGTYTAVFGEPAVVYYTVTAVADPVEGGTVTGGNTVASGQTVTLTATPNEGYDFIGWNDGNPDNPRTVVVTQNLDLTAKFQLKSFNLTVTATPSNGGTVTGGGTYPYGQMVEISATPNEGWVFLNWNDGESLANRTVRVLGDATYTALFADTTTTTYTITAIAFDASLGTVTGGGVYPEGTEVALTAVPFGINVFVKWNDNNTDNPRTITVTEDHTYIAVFETPELYTITVESDNEEQGTVTGGGAFPMGTEIQIEAIPNGGYYFKEWNDGNKDNPRTIVVSGAATYKAKFSSSQVQSFTVTVTCNPAHGFVEGTGNYQEGATATLKATPWDGYVFDHWNDGNKNNPRTVTVTDNVTYVAFFKANSGPVITHTITVLSMDETMGTVTGGGVYPEGEMVTIEAIPLEGYIFVGWGDGLVDNPRIITVTKDDTYEAYFQSNAVNEFGENMLNLYPNPAKESVRIEGLENETEMRIYNSLGKMVKVMSVNADQEINVSDLAPGIYMIRCGRQTLRFVKE
ncbi:MAG: choice-of-anchor J domain-containing protein [Bacteroidales bacterium]|nr:choice-of-anchor J domain-containing protein [Bacteroidales bacterium]